MHKLSGRSASFARPEPFDPRRKALRVKTLLPNSKVLAEEVTACLQGLEHLLQELTGQLCPSGFLDLGQAHPDGQGLHFGVAPNAYALDSGVVGRPLPVLVAGRLLWLGGASTGGTDPLGFGADNDRYCTLVLPAAPTTGTRDDLVFLETWVQELDDQSTYWPWGCVQYLGSPLTNDILNTSYGATLYNKDLVLRWRLRVASAVDFAQHPWGLGAANVMGQAGAATPSSYPFTNMHETNGDSGLWRAGDGSDQARAALASTDGYCFALPLQRVHRRNQQAFSPSNPNGNSASLGQTCDRPDGLFHDQITPRDVLDLRYRVSLRGVDLPGILSRFTGSLLANQARDTLPDSPLSPEVNGRVWLHPEAITATPLAGMDVRHAPDAIRRRFDDDAVTQATVGFLSTGSDDADLGGRLRLLQATATVVIDAPVEPVGVLVGAATPVLRWVSTGAQVAVSGAWAGLGTASASVALDTGHGTYQAAGECCVEFDLDYPPHGGLRFRPVTLHRADIHTTDVMVVTQDVADLSLANLAANGAYGLAFHAATRGLVEIARRQTIAANANGVARASSLVLDASAGTPAGGLVTGLTPSQSIDVVAAYTPGTADQIRLFYDVVPAQTQVLPESLSVEVLHLAESLQVCNLGTGGGTGGGAGGGTVGTPYPHPLLHIPEHAGLSRDSQLRNDVDLDSVLHATSTGLLQLPLVRRDALERLTRLDTPVTDEEGRQAYLGADVDLVFQAPDLETAQWHRTLLWAVARVTQTQGTFLAQELLGLVFTDTSNDTLNQAGVGTGTCCVGVYKLQRLHPG